jgi:hypothetical protein
MKITKSIRSVTLAGAAALLMAGGLSAANITFNTNGASTGFNGTSALTLHQTSGSAATLTFTPNSSFTVATPSNVQYGDFQLSCNLCGNSPGGPSSTFGAFTFNLMVTDLTDNATGIFVGTSSGGAIFADLSPIDINWSPLQIGPGTASASSGNFGNTLFQITNLTRIVSPNNGTPPGDTTVQGNVASTTPEPATFALIGSGLLAVAFARRKKSLLQ